jgi:transposase-like protein
MKPSQHIISYIREARQHGKSLNRICHELGLCASVVSRWMRQGLGMESNG